MKSIGTFFLRISLAALICIGMFSNASPTAGAAAGDKHSRKKCEKHCDETYKHRKHACKQLRKWERKPCEEASQEARGVCKFRCR
jgi:hypothetical protein